MTNEKTEPAHRAALVAKLVEVIAELGPIEKKGRNVHFGYDFTKESQIMAELRHRLAKRNVFFTTSVETLTSAERTNQKGNTEVLVSVTTRHAFHDADTGASLEVLGAGMGIDQGDKGVYKAITGATKYALMKNFMVSDELDPEGADESARLPKHTRTTAYEKGKKDTPAAKADLKTLRKWLTDSDIPEAWVMGELRDKGLADLDEETLDDLKPGVATRVLKSSGRLATSYLQFKKAGGEKAEDEIPMKHAGDEQRTREGDQSRSDVRQPVKKGTNVEQLLVDYSFTGWRDVPIHWGEQKGELLGDITEKSLSWWINKWVPKPYKNKGISKDDILLDAALCVASAELAEGGE